MTTKEYKVGQLIYIILDDNDLSLPIPAVIVEENINKSIISTKKIYNISFSSDFKKKISLDKIKGEIFDNIDEMENELFSRAKQSITEMMNRVRVKSNELTDVLESLKQEDKEELFL